MGTVIAGFSPTDKVPGGYGEVLPGTGGGASASSIPIKLLLLALKQAAGSAVPDVDVVPMTSPGDAITAFGPRARMTRMARIALLQQGINLFGMAITEAGGAVAAFVLLTIGGSWTAAGTYSFRIGGETINGVWGTADTIANVCTNIAASINQNPNICYTAAAGATTVTITATCKGTTSNRDIIFDMSVPPTGGTITKTTVGAAVTGTGFFFQGGTGTEDITNALAAIVNSTYDRIVLGSVDGANALKLSNQLISQAGVLTGRLQHGIIGSNDSLVNATTIAQTTLNAYRMQVGWYFNSETHPGEVAAALGALRITKEAVYPNASFDGNQLLGVAPQSMRQDRPSHATKNSALNNSVTPIDTTDDGKAVVVRSIQTHSLNGSTPDFNTLDTSGAIVPDFCLTSALLKWAVVAASNVVAQDNPAFTDKSAPAGVITPAIWQALLYGMMKQFEAGTGFPGPLVQLVDQYPPQANWDSVGQRIMSTLPAVNAVAPHQCGVSVRPIPAP